MDIGVWQVTILIIIFFVVWLRLAKNYRTKEVEQYNKKHNKNYKTREELEKYLKIKIEKEVKAKKKKRIEKEEIVEEVVEDGLMNKIKRLKKLYINGTLTKAEFEKAKNKLLT